MKNTYNRRPQTPRKYYYVNNNIEALELRVIDSEGGQLGLMTREQAIQAARAKDMDLVLIAPGAKPPVAKITEFQKFLYQEEKKAKEAKKGIKKSTVKDIKLSLFIAQGDFERFIEKGKEFLDEGNQLRLNLNLKGREMAKKEMAFELVKKFIAQMGDVNVAKEPRLEGRVVRTVIARKK